VRLTSTHIRLALFSSILLSGAVTAPARASAAPSCAAAFDPYAAAPATLGACGMRSYPARSLATVPGGPAAGATTYRYQLGATTVTALVPPASFDPATAGRAELLAYGVPAEPADPVARSLWLTMTRRMHFARPPARLITAPDGVSAAVTNAAWAGIVNTSSGPSPYQTSAAIWVEPTQQATACRPSSAVYWNGLGGVRTDVLAQDGTAQGVPGLADDQAWFEVLPVEPGIIPIPIVATPGAAFLTGTQYQGSNTFGFFFYSYASGASAYYQATDSGYDGHTADYVAERLSGGLLDFGQISFLTTLTNGIAANSYPYEGYTMAEGADILAVPHNVQGPGGFQINWQACR
jgi:hypothetical protein